MTPSQRVFRHTLIQLVSKATSLALGLVAVGIMTRYLGREGFGAYTTITAYLGVVAVLVDFGISTTVIAMLSEKDADEFRLARNAFGLRIVSAALALALSAAAALLITPYTPEIKAGIAILAVSFLFVAVNQVQVAVFQRQVRMDRPAIAEVAGRALLVLGIALAAGSGAGLFGVLLAVIAANALQAVLSQILLRPIIILRPAFESEIWKSILGRSWPIGVAIIFNLIYLRADTLILSLSRSQEEVGLYGAAYRVIDVLTIFPMLFMGIVLPFLSTAWSSGNKERFGRILGRALDALSLAVAPLVFGAVLTGPDLMELIAGADFRLSGEILRILIFGVGAIYVAAVFTHAVVAMNAQRRMIPWLAADAFVSLILYLLLIPRYGMWAAAWITVFSEVLAGIAALAVALTAGGFSLRWRVPFRASLAALLMVVSDSLAAGWPLLPRIAFDALFFLAAALALRAVTPRTIAELLAWRQGRLDREGS